MLLSGRITTTYQYQDINTLTSVLHLANVLSIQEFMSVRTLHYTVPSTAQTQNMDYLWFALVVCFNYSNRISVIKQSQRDSCLSFNKTKCLFTICLEKLISVCCCHIQKFAYNYSNYYCSEASKNFNNLSCTSTKIGNYEKNLLKIFWFIIIRAEGWRFILEQVLHIYNWN